MSHEASRLADALTGRYRIQRPLGAGGMATVYLADDLRHSRPVAIKVLRPELAQAIGPERFLREIEIAASLRHPHILPLFDSGEAADLLFYIMPYVAGLSLRARLERDRRIPAEEALRIAVQIADALAYAHERDVVHRDIKPENVLLERGHAFVMDFGIARAATVAGLTRMTHGGSVLGTPAYMSPEQTAADSDVDGRSDLYSLACMLFEMLAGVPPFSGPSSESILVQRFVQPPPRLSAAADGMPSWIDAALFRAMARDPADRFATVAHFATALAHPPSRPDEAREKSIAVLPFANMSGSTEEEYFSDGIAEEITNALAQLQGLRVAARTSAFAFKGKNEDLRLIGEKLNVGTVLEGSVRRAGSRLRITAQLVNVTDGYHLWSERYDRDLTDVFAVQDEIAASIAAKLKVMLSSGREKPARRGTANLEAYELFLKGRALQYRRGGMVVRAAECFERAVALDPNYGEALAWLSDSYRLMGTYGLRPPGEVMPRAREIAERALALDPGLDEAYATLADVALTYDFDAQAALHHWDRALTLNPGHTRSRCEFAFWGACCLEGSMERAIAEVKRAAADDPLNAYVASMHALVLGCAGRLDDALAEARRALELDPESFVARWLHMQASSWAGDHASAIAAARPALAMSGRSPWALGALAGAHGRAGQAELAQAIYEELLARARSEYVQKGMIALAALGAGWHDEAVELAVRAAEERDSVALIAMSYPDWAPVRGHPRFAELRRRMGLK